MKEELIELLVTDTEKCCTKLQELAKSNESLLNQIVVIKSRYFEAKRNMIMGTLQFDEYDRLKRNIDLALIETITTLTKGDIQKQKIQINNNDSVSDLTLEQMIDWVEGNFAKIHAGYDEESESERSKWVISKDFMINELKINLNGTFKIIYEETVEEEMTRGKDNSKRITKRVSIKQYTGNLRDVVKIEISDEPDDKFATIFFSARYNKELFGELVIQKYYEDYEETKPIPNKIRKVRFFGFDFDREQLDLVAKLQDRINLICIKLGRIEEIE